MLKVNPHQKRLSKPKIIVNKNTFSFPSPKGVNRSGNDNFQEHRKIYKLYKHYKDQINVWEKKFLGGGFEEFGKFHLTPWIITLFISFVRKTIILFIKIVYKLYL